MDLVKVNLYAEAFYSGTVYEDNIWIKRSSYEQLKENISPDISCGELDGKHSEVRGDVNIYDREYTEKDYKREGELQCDGYYLESSLRDIYEENGLDWCAEQKEIADYFDTLNLWKEITVKVPRDKVRQLMEYVEKLRMEDN